WLKQIASEAQEANGSKLVPLFVTEIGWPTHQGKHGATLQDAATFLSQLYPGARQVPALRGVWWYTLLDDPGSMTDPEAHFGLLLPDKTPKPAYIALRNVAREWHGAGKPNPKEPKQ